jgi:hypothetical protein
MKEALSSSETSVLTRAIRRNILEDAILHEGALTSCYPSGIHGLYRHRFTSYAYAYQPDNATAQRLTHLWRWARITALYVLSQHDQKWKYSWIMKQLMLHSISCFMKVIWGLPIYFGRECVWRMASSRMLRRVALVGTDVSEELSASETSVPTRATRRNIPEHAIFHSRPPWKPQILQRMCVSYEHEKKKYRTDRRSLFANSVFQLSCITSATWNTIQYKVVNP